ncbi:MAG: hypothetical protein WC829_18205 [Hyphomicrobium sp.]|jgi:hypothetical protein
MTERVTAEQMAEWKALADRITGPCSCHPGYRDRQLVAPDCIFHMVNSDIVAALDIVHCAAAAPIVAKGERLREIVRAIATAKLADADGTIDADLLFAIRDIARAALSEEPS